jgi:hypothetical protein
LIFNTIAFKSKLTNTTPLTKIKKNIISRVCKLIYNLEKQIYAAEEELKELINPQENTKTL